MAENRIPRELETRATQQRPKQWAPAELLPEPDKLPGFEYHWKRVSINNVSDARNMSATHREGWEPCLLTEQPKFQLLADPSSKFKDNIEIGGLLLCKRPEELGKQEKEYFANQTRAQSEAVDNNLMRQSDSRMPIFQERRSTTSFGRGSN
jgi:hypothetical protein